MAVREASQDKREEDSRQNPEHTGVTKDTASTPGYFRLFLPGLAARYIPRWLVGAENDVGIFGWLFANKTKGESQSIIESLEPGADAAKRADGLKRLEAIGYKGKFSSPQEAYNNAVNNRATLANIDTRLRGHGIDVSETLASTEKYASAISRGEEIERELSRATTHHDNWEDFKSGVKNTIRKQHSNRMLDRILGGGSAGLTSFYAYRVSSDIRKVFAETVAYETGKDPKDVTVKDFWNSDNVLVKATVKNFLLKNLFRYATDAVFFVGDILRMTRLTKLNPWFKNASNLPYTDLGVGVKGATLLVEINNKENTAFEYLVQLIDSKLNPTRGIGDQIKSSELIDLYQKWAKQVDPKAAFTDATIHQNRDDLDWGKAHVVFNRIADLMNATYKYKHGEEIPVSGNETANLALPKYLYLLGHSLIDTHNLERTLAYVEVANHYGIEEVKNMQAMCRRNMPLEQVLERYPAVDKSRLKFAKQEAVAVAAAQPTPEPEKTPVPISFFPAKESSFTHSNENQPTTQIAADTVEKTQQQSTERQIS